MRTSNYFTYITLCIIFITSNIEAESISTSQLRALDSIATNYKIEICTDSTIKKGLENKECKIAARLYDFTAWLLSIGTDSKKIIEQLDKRYAGFTSKDKLSIDTSLIPWAGDHKSPIEIVAYVSANCNLCKHIVGELYDEVTKGKLKGKVKLAAKPFGTGIGDIALFAAMDQGKFWDLFLAMKEVKTRIKEENIMLLVKNIGIDKNAFSKSLNDPKYQANITASRAEGSKIGVEVTPVFFINGKRYSSYKDSRWVADAAMYEFEQK